MNNSVKDDSTSDAVNKKLKFPSAHNILSLAYLKTNTWSDDSDITDLI